MLTKPRRAWKITELAQAVDVSLGQVANVKKLLADREWLASSDVDSGPNILLLTP
jgi:hypothetical protein